MVLLLLVWLTTYHVTCKPYSKTNSSMALQQSSLVQPTHTHNLYTTVRLGLQDDTGNRGCHERHRRNLCASGQNSILNVQNFDNLIGWMPETLCLRHWNRNQFFSTITLAMLAMQCWY